MAASGAQRAATIFCSHCLAPARSPAFACALTSTPYCATPSPCPTLRKRPTQAMARSDSPTLAQALAAMLQRYSARRSGSLICLAVVPCPAAAPALPSPARPGAGCSSSATQRSASHMRPALAADSTSLPIVLEFIGMPSSDILSNQDRAPEASPAFAYALSTVFHSMVRFLAGAASRATTKASLAFVASPAVARSPSACSPAGLTPSSPCPFWRAHPCAVCSWIWGGTAAGGGGGVQSLLLRVLWPDGSPRCELRAAQLVKQPLPTPRSRWSPCCRRRRWAMSARFAAMWRSPCRR
mmetsp:Transcript_85482/g.250220  ORF Transcript_85482/g.250220 Transcript_85482/m.250220 type:complete len:297 (-) Transcript_85482:276-1166(-)